MTDVGVATGAVGMVAVSGQLADERFVATNAVVLDDRQAAFLDADRLVEILEGESPGMAKAVLGLGEVFANKIVRHMAVVAGGNRVMRTLAPTVELVTHDVAVHAGLGIVREVARPLGIVEREASQAQENPKAGGSKDSKRGQADAGHPMFLSVSDCVQV